MKILVLLVLFIAALESSAQDSMNPSDEETEEDYPFDTYCKPPPDRGPCNGHYPSWWFNTATGSCEQFVYTGCEGNNNNYATKENCELTCLMRGDASPTSNPNQQQEDEEAQMDCFVKPEKGPCRASDFRYYFDPESATCGGFIYGGCQGNDNNYKTEDECLAKCRPLQEYQRMCLVPADRGKFCRMSWPQWAYNGTTGQCIKFSYSGCLGNDNRYDTQEDCEATCQRKPGTVNPVCFQPKYEGPCGANETWYYFNRWSKTCEEFIYGGCRGNGNNFPTLELCQTTCGEVCRKKTSP